MPSRHRLLATFAALVLAASLAGCTQALQGSKPVGAPVAFASSPSGRGYWVAYANGAVRGYGDARPYGGTSRIALRRPIVGMTASRSGHGYWLVAADGGVFSFGDAAFRGSLGKRHVRTGIVAMARTKSGRGYWLAGADGSVYSFGDAQYRGSAKRMRSKGSVAGIAATRSGKGYWLVSRNGGVFAFGDATFLGSAYGRARGSHVTGLRAAEHGRAYWVVTGTGKVFGFGGSGYRRAGFAPPNLLVGLVTDGAAWRVVNASGGTVRFSEWGAGAPDTGSTPAPPTPAPGNAPPANQPPAIRPPAKPPANQPAPPRPAPPVNRPPGNAAPAPTNLGNNIVDYVKQHGDQVITVPNGTYRAGSVNASHPATNGAYKGWLVLRAQSLHGVVVDLRGAQLDLQAGTTRVLFVGFRFVNGSVDVQGQDIGFWYTDHAFPAQEWVAQAPNKSRPEQGYYRAPRTVYAYEGSTKRVSFYGADMHDTSSGILVSKSEDVLLQGAHLWNFGDGGLDPQDVTHSDAIAGVAGQSTGLTVRDSWVQGRIMLIDANGDKSIGGPHRDFLFENDWVSDSPSGGFTFTSRKPAPPWGIFGRRVNVRSWGHNNGLDRLEIIAGQQIRAANTQPSRVNVVDSGISTSPPPAGASSPAAVWRAQHPYESWSSYLF